MLDWKKELNYDLYPRPVIQAYYGTGRLNVSSPIVSAHPDAGKTKRKRRGVDADDDKQILQRIQINSDYLHSEIEAITSTEQYSPIL